MKRNNKIILNLILMFVLSTGTFCANLSTGWIILRKLQSPKPRPLTAIMPVRGDLSGILYNPSLLGTMQRIELFTFGELGLAEDKFAGFLFGYPFTTGSAIATGLISYDTGVITIYHIEHGQEVKTTISSQNDLLWLLSYGKTLFDKFHAGISLKLATSIFVEKYRAYAYGTDIGINYSPFNNFMTSFAIQNLGESTKFYEQVEKLPTSLWLGIGYLQEFSLKHELFYLILSGDISYIISDSRYIPSVGIEIGKPPIELFCGYKFNTTSVFFTTGLSLSLKDFNLSYSFTPTKWLNPIHRISLCVKFGKPVNFRSNPL